MHYVCLPWSIFYAFMAPPPIFYNGWMLFVAALWWIAAITAAVCDLALAIGCCLRIDNAVTAITVVALGTSLPDLFASQTAALEDEYADASIVNVTGSNSVNVFLGIGIPWTIAAIYWAARGPDAKWERDYSDLLDASPKGAFVVRG